VTRELAEVLHQWEEPVVVDDRRYREAFGGRTTVLDDAARATVAWATRTFGTAAPRPALG
jgi:hypothetical protein